MKKNRHSILWAALLLLQSISLTFGAGVTMITHGLDGNADGWVTGMANQIPAHTAFPGSSYTSYKLYFISVGGGSYQITWTRLAGSQPALTDSGEIIVALDWSQLADGYSFDTYQIAGVVSAALQNTSFISELNGHALCELPLHLIGHSRGGSLMSEISLRLGTNGIWLDHLTTLDPHPLNNDGFFDFIYSAIDAPVRTYENVLFHDNYWQNVAILVYGEPVFGAYVRQLYNVSGGYQNIGDSHYPHSNVHLWYHGTVDERNPASDTEAQITSTEFNNWYVPNEDFGFNAGFKWSLIGGGNRTSTDRPVGSGNPAIRDGYNQAWDLGAGQSANRIALPSNNGNWPNVIKFNMLRTNQAQQGTSISVKEIYQWAQPTTSTATLSFYLDDDFNPLNGNSRLLQQVSVPGSGASFVNFQTVTLGLNATNAPVGPHAIYAKITGGARTRYLYAPEILTVTPPPDIVRPTVVITNPPSAKTFTNAQTLTISASASDNIGVARVDFYDGATLKGSDVTAAYSYDWAFTVVDNGAHIWTARAYDAAGNVATSAPVTLTVSIDLTAPVVSIFAPTNGQVYATAAITVAGTASDLSSPTTGVATVEVRTNGGAWLLATGTTSWTRAVTLSPCANAIDVRSRDGAGNYSAVVSVAVTYTPPDNPPITPINLLPTNGASDVTVTPMLQAGAFSDVDCTADTHVASQWQVLNGPGAVIVWDSGTNSVDKSSIVVPAGKLVYASNYLWKVRYEDNRGAWSAYSATTGFRTILPTLHGTRQGTNFLLQWPTSALSFTLQSATNLATGNWGAAMPGPVVVTGQYTVTNGIGGSNRFYRLKRP